MNKVGTMFNISKYSIIIYNNSVGRVYHSVIICIYIMI